MIISVDGLEILSLSEIKKKVICNDILSEIFEEDINRRLHYAVMHKYEQCFKRLKEEWEPKLASRMRSIPTDPEEFSELVFSQPDYKNRSERDKSLI